METEEMPEEGDYLELWVDIEEAGEPIVAYWQGEEGEDLFESWIRWLEHEQDYEIESAIQPDPEIGEWLVRASEPAIAGGGVSNYWVKFRNELQ